MSVNDYNKEELRGKFLDCLKCNNSGSVVDDLIKVLEEDYILLKREELYCKDCFNCNTVNYGFSDLVHDAYCSKHQRRIQSIGFACDDYLGAELEARKSIARMHNELSGDIFL